mgnify:CR=1 FL=1
MTAENNFTGLLEPVVDIPDRGLEVRSIQPSTISVEITQTLTATLGISNSLEISGTVPLTDSQRLPKPDDNLLSQVSGGATAVAAPAAIRVQRLFIDLPRQVLIL